MAAIRPSRLFIIKFLGLWGSQQQQEKKLEDYNSKDKIFGENKLSNLNRFTEPHLDGNNNNNNDNHNEAINNIYKKAVDTSSRKITSLMLEKGMPGLTICVSKRGKIVWHSAFGFCDVENQLACQPEAQMRIASISKPLFVSTVVAPMIDEKKIDIKSSIYKYLSYDDFPKQKFDNQEYDITIEQLLSHTSGIRDYKDCDEDKRTLLPICSKGSKKVYQNPAQYNREEFYTRKTYRSNLEALDVIKNGPLANKPGEYNYTSYGYTLLSAVIEKAREKQNSVDNKSKQQEIEQIEDFWIKILHKDWDMRETYLDHDEVIIPNRARYYLRTGARGTLINAPYTDLSVKWAGGGINSTVKDIVKFGNKLIDCYKERKNAILKKETVELLWKQVHKNYCLGFFVRKFEDENDKKFSVYHSGGALGASSMLLIYPESEIVVAILTNLGEVGMTDLSLFIADQFERIN